MSTKAYHTPGPNEKVRFSFFSPRLITTTFDTPGGYRPSMVEYSGLILPLWDEFRLEREAYVGDTATTKLIHTMVSRSKMEERVAHPRNILYQIPKAMKGKYNDLSVSIPADTTWKVSIRSAKETMGDVDEDIYLMPQSTGSLDL